MNAERIDREVFAHMPDGSVQVRRDVKSPQQAGISFFYREATPLEYMGYWQALENLADTFTADIIDRCTRHGWHESRAWHKKMLSTYVRLNWQDGTPEQQKSLAWLILTRLEHRYIFHPAPADALAAD